MENNRTIILLLKITIMSGILLCIPVFVLAYNSDVTHPELTKAIVDFYNSEFLNNKISDGEKLYVIKGSIEEDAFGRWMRHFYDPVYNKGLSYLGNWESSKNWAQDHKSQAKLDPKMFFLAAVAKPFDGSTDYSWERSVYEYAWGDEQRGLEGLGHILHLLEDAAVPDHTRNDPHPTGSVYEGFAIGKEIKPVAGKKAVILNSVDDYFEEAAGYSNTNFFSKDTIFDKRYGSPQILKEKIELFDGRYYRFGYRSDSFGADYKLVKIEFSFGNKNPEFSIDDRSGLILSDYWSLLSEQVVLDGAGMVNLFFNEVEKEKKSKKLLAYNKSPSSKFLSSIAGIFYSPTIRQANEDPEIAEDLGLLTVENANRTNWTNETYKEEYTVGIIPIVVLAPEKPADSPPVLKPKMTSPAMPIAGGGGAPPPEEQIGPMENSSPPGDEGDEGENEDSGGENPPPENPVPPAPPADADAPNIGYSITECDSSVASNGCLLLSGANLNISWSSTSTDLASYTVECASGGNNCSGFPIANTTSTSTAANLSARGLYTLTFKSKDAANNQNSTTTQIEINPNPVVINEVAWMGTEADATDEWIELFNSSGFNINLGDGAAASWTIEATDGNPDIFLNGTILAGGYFVLERTNSSTTSYAENQIFTGAINDLFPGGGDNLALKNPAGSAIDSTVLVSEVAIVSGTKVPQRKSAERINPFYYSSTYEENALNWRTASSTLSVVTDKDGAVILGTPGAQNSIYSVSWRPTHIKKTDVISSDTEWTVDKSPYVITSQAFESLTINSGSTLTIDPGVIVMQYITSPGAVVYPMIRVNGKITAEGTDAKNIVFTSLLDSDYGGWGGSTKGDWSRVIFSASSVGNSFKKVKFRYGGWYDWLWDPGTRPVFEIDPSAGITFDDVVFEKSYRSVFMLAGEGFSGISIQNSLFSDNGSAPFASAGNIYLENGASPAISGNNFLNNNVYPITIRSAYPNVGSNSASGNPINGVFVREDSVFNSNATWSGSLPYVLESSGIVPWANRPVIGASSVLNINPGVVLKPLNNTIDYLRIDGILNWSAAPENPGIVTSFKDDSYGGDTNNDGAATSPAVGDLFNGGIHFTNTTATSTLSNILLRYGNPGNEISQDAGALLEKTNVVSGP